MDSNIDSIKRILVIDFCNYDDYQIGGHLSFVKNLMSAFGDKLTLVGITTTKDDPIGQWFNKSINGVIYNFFALKRYDKSKTKHLLPDRLICFLLLKYYKRRISRINIQNVFVQRHEILPAIEGYRFQNICYCFPGLESPLKISKYWFSKYLEKLFNEIFYSSLKNVKTILASGDDEAIDEMVMRSKGIIKRDTVKKFPVRINTDIFRPLDKLESREKLNIPARAVIVVTTGRLAWLKGWKFMIDCFSLFLEEVQNSFFYIIGEGEDFQKIQEYIFLNGLQANVILVGGKKLDEVSLFLNASDLFIMGSYKEGWSTSLSEAISCGIPSCVTNFSSAKDIIKEGLNGYVVNDHDVNIFTKSMFDAYKMKRPVYNNNVKAFSVDKLSEDLLKIWKLI
jgi:glycosyltransferase involved in cell wall biosynthesis